MRWLVVASVALGVSSVAVGAQAAAQAPCVAARVLPASATVPANLPGFAYTARKATVDNVHLLAGPGKTATPVTVAASGDFLKITPTSALVVGTSYELQYEPFCNRGGSPTLPLTFTVVAAAPLPTTVGTVGTAPTVTLKDFGTTQFTITASYAFAAEMKPWAAVYDLAVEVDGRTIGTTKTQTADKVDVVGVGWCDEKSAAVQKHPVRLVGTLPFASLVATPVTELDFSCPAPNIGRPPPGNPKPGTPLTTVTPDGGTAPVGASPTTPTSSGSGSGSSGGCAMSRRGTETSFAGLALALGLVIAAARRRR